MTEQEKVEAKQYIITVIKKSTLVTPHPCFIKSVSLSQSSGEIITFYDGESTSGEIKNELLPHIWGLSFFDYSRPVYFSKGLYVGYSSGTTSITIQYILE